MDKFFNIAAILILLTQTLQSAGNQNFKQDSINARNLYFKSRELADKALYKNAIDSFKVTLQLYKDLYGDSNRYVASIQMAIGINYKNIGQYDKSLGYFLAAEKSYLISNSFNSLSNVYNNIGVVYENKLDYQTALEYYKRSINLLMNQEVISDEDIADVYYSIANMYNKINRFEDALEIIKKYKTFAYPDTKIYYSDLQSVIFQSIKEYNKADASYEEAIRYAIDYTSKKHIFVALEYLNYASFLITTGNMKKAAKILKNAYDIIIITQQEEGLDLAQYYSLMGDYYVNKSVESNEIATFKRQNINNLKEAINYYKNGQKALNFSFKIGTDSIPDLGNSLSLIQSLNTLKSIADTHVKISEIYDDVKEDNYITALDSAMIYYEVTANLIQDARKEINDEESKLLLIGLEQETFQKMINTAHKAYQVSGKIEIIDFAFKNAEQIKASSIYDQLSGELAKNNLIPDSIIELEKTLNYSITQNNETLYYLTKEEKPDTVAIAMTDSILFQLKRQRDELNRHMENNYPGFYNLKYADLMFGVKDIQHKLKKNEVLIEYSLNENGSTPELYMIFISKTRIKFINPEIDTSFIAAVENTFRFMSNTRYMFTKNADSKKFCISSNLLYEKLILPIRNEIKEKKILIVPDGKLSYISFDALIEELPDTTSPINFASLKYLIKSNSIHYSYSANLLYKFEKPNRTANKRLIAFAPEYSLDTFVFDNQHLTLTPLPGIQKEVDLISKEIKSQLFKGDDATEINFHQNSENYDILHLAMHAFIDDEKPAFSRLAFMQNEMANSNNDGWINTADIYNLDLNARLTVLSACNTGSGQLRKGEGVMSLARGFLYAGCPSIVMTLWEVDDKAGTDIMTSFYKNLKRGRTTDDALRLAKLNYLENANPRTAHPHYWLGYVSIGNNTPLFRSYDYYFFGLLILALIAIIIDQVVRSKKSNRTEK